MVLMQDGHLLMIFPELFEQGLDLLAGLWVVLNTKKEFVHVRAIWKFN